MNCLGDRYARFCDLLILAENYVAAGNYRAAVGLAQIAARYAFPGHVGLFGSPRLERILLDIGKHIPLSPTCDVGPEPRNKTHRNVLHILSYGRPIGGDSRFVWRWMQEDLHNRHCVAITTQSDLSGIYDVPNVLRESAERTGGFLKVLSAPPSNPLEQAKELRALSQEMDIIVLHLFPYDVIPVLAFAIGCDSIKIIFVNHSDHTFWIGASVAHSVVHLRRQPPNFLTKRRGLNPEQYPILPIPMTFSQPSITSEEAKRTLGYDPNVVVLLTIASPHKYSAPGLISFLDLVTPVLVEHPEAVLIAVGPEPKGAWISANIQTSGRVMALGTRWDNELIYAAADVYLDSIPFSSITSLLEAGIHGIPLLGYRHPNPDLELLGPGAPGLENAIELASDIESYRTLLKRLIYDAPFRVRRGEHVQTSILSLHRGSKWLKAVHELYKRVERTNNRECLGATSDKFEDSALNSALINLYGSGPLTLSRSIRKFLGPLAYRTRMPLTWHLYHKGLGLCFLNLLPPPIDAIIHRIGHWAKKGLIDGFGLR